MLPCFSYGARDIYQKPSMQANGLFSDSEWGTYSAQGMWFSSFESANQFYRAEFGTFRDGRIHSLNFFSESVKKYSIAHLNAHSVVVSNSGLLMASIINPHSEIATKFLFYSKKGLPVYSKEVLNPGSARFSRSGNVFGYFTKENLEILDPQRGIIQRFRPGHKFDISNDGSVVVVSYEKGASIYLHGKLIREIQTGFIYNRAVQISPDNEKLALADIRTLNLYSLPAVDLVWSDRLDESESFRDLLFDSDVLWAGIKYEDEFIRQGQLKTYNLDEATFSESFVEILAQESVGHSGLDIQAFNRKYNSRPSKTGYPALPWPYRPQDEPDTVWNNYEALNSSGDGVVNSDYPYLHQGIDIEVQVNDPIYSIDTGIVKFQGETSPGGLYWRICVARGQTADYSNGWMYAHLVQKSINYDVGDRITKTGLHLANTIAWTGGVIAAHLHLNEIRDHGLTWSFTDDQWGITYNPLLSLTPSWDTTAPVIEKALANKSKFAYAPNNSGYAATSSTYFFPDSARGGVQGSIDITVKLYDRIVHDNWTQPAYEIHYWIRSDSRNHPYFDQNVVDTTLAQIRNHSYDHYGAATYKPASQVLYTVDNAFKVGGWFNRTRRFAHVLTNNNGDSLLTPGEKDSSLNTRNYFDGWYQIYVKALDHRGNAAIDSERVYFNNGIIVPIDSKVKSSRASLQFTQTQSLGVSEIHFTIPVKGHSNLKIYRQDGKKIKSFFHGEKEAGEGSTSWDGRDDTGNPVGKGLFILSLKGHGFSISRKIIRH